MPGLPSIETHDSCAAGFIQISLTVASHWITANAKEDAHLPVIGSGVELVKGRIQKNFGGAHLQAVMDSYFDLRYLSWINTYPV